MYVSIKGSQTNPVQNIAISDITFAHTTTTFLSDYAWVSEGIQIWGGHRLNRIDLYGKK